MKMKQTAAGAVCACMMLSGGLTAQAATTIPIENPHAGVVVEGYPAVFPNAEGDTLYPLIAYQGTTYLPLRTAGLWMGKEVGWDAATQTVTLSGNVTKEYPVRGEAKMHYDAEGEGTVSPEITVTLDGKKVDFINAKGETVYPIAFEGATYLPLRNIGELTGLSVTWRNARSERESNGIYLRTPITEAEKAEMLAYANTLYDKLEKLTDIIYEASQKYVREETGRVNAYGEKEAEFVLNDVEWASKALPEMKAIAQEVLATMPEPKWQLPRYYYQLIVDVLNHTVSYSDVALEKIKTDGKIIIGVSTSEEGVDKIDHSFNAMMNENALSYADRMIIAISEDLAASRYLTRYTDGH